MARTKQTVRLGNMSIDQLLAMRAKTLSAVDTTFNAQQILAAIDRQLRMRQAQSEPAGAVKRKADEPLPNPNSGIKKPKKKLILHLCDVCDEPFEPNAADPVCKNCSPANDSSPANVESNNADHCDDSGK